MYINNSNENIEQFINTILNNVVLTIQSLVGSSLKAIVLYGGFGRDEGSVTVINNTYKIVNDIDLEIYVKNNYLLNYFKYNRKLLFTLDILAEQNNIKQIDAEIRTESIFLKNAQQNIANYELYYGHKVIYGAINLNKFLYRVSVASEIPLEEGTTFFINRGTGLLICAKYFVNVSEINDKHKENFCIECLKAILAMGDSILLLNKSYHYSYNERKNIFINIPNNNYPHFDEIKSLYLFALDQKLNPDYSKFETIDLIKWYFKIKNLYSAFFLYYESIKYKVRFNSWEEYILYLNKNLSINYLKIIKKLILNLLNIKSISDLSQISLRNNIISDRRNRLILTCSLLFSLNYHKIDYNLLSYSQKVIHLKIYKLNKPAWCYLANIYLNSLSYSKTIKKAIEL